MHGRSAKLGSEFLKLLKEASSKAQRLVVGLRTHCSSTPTVDQETYYASEFACR